MKSYAIINSNQLNDRSNKLIDEIAAYIKPKVYKELSINNLKCGYFNINSYLENLKFKHVYRKVTKTYDHVISKEYNVNYNIEFYYSALVRALDLYTISKGIDIRLNEIVIADAAREECVFIFKLLAPIAKRVILVTKDKNRVYKLAKFAMDRFGLSVVITEDPIKATASSDVIVLSSKDEAHNMIAKLNRPMLYISSEEIQRGDMSFDDIEISFKNELLDIEAAQGYVDLTNKEIIWKYAEEAGFKICSIKKGSEIILDKR